MLSQASLEFNSLGLFVKSITITKIYSYYEYASLNIFPGATMLAFIFS
jgi:hypothetical protein